MRHTEEDTEKPVLPSEIDREWNPLLKQARLERERKAEVAELRKQLRHHSEDLNVVKAELEICEDMVSEMVSVRDELRAQNDRVIRERDALMRERDQALFDRDRLRKVMRADIDALKEDLEVAEESARGLTELRFALKRAMDERDELMQSVNMYRRCLDRARQIYQDRHGKTPLHWPDGAESWVAVFEKYDDVSEQAQGFYRTLHVLMDQLTLAESHPQGPETFLEYAGGALRTALYKKVTHQSEEVSVASPTHDPIDETGPLVSLAREIHGIAASKGWEIPTSWDDDAIAIGAKLALIHSEVSEALEACREDDEENFAEELADTIIRILHLCSGLDIDIDEEIAKKMDRNRVRSHRHGGKRF